MQHHKYSLTELESMLPWERDIYVNLLVQYIEEENEKIKQKQATMKRWTHQVSNFNNTAKAY